MLGDSPVSSGQKAIISGAAVPLLRPAEVAGERVAGPFRQAAEQSEGCRKKAALQPVFSLACARQRVRFSAVS